MDTLLAVREVQTFPLKAMRQQLEELCGQVVSSCLDQSCELYGLKGKTGDREANYR